MAVEVAMPTTPLAPRWQFWRRFHWTRRSRLIGGSIGVALIVIAGGLLWIGYTPKSEVANKPAPTPTPAPTPEPKDHADPLNGVLYTASDYAKFANLRPVAVMVENHVLARPQSGLQEADAIYEAMAEGGITRFMALYLAGQPDKIGPVRSARLHFVNWAAEYNATYAHWGGSAEALNYVQNHSQPKNLDEFAFGGAFWRDYSGGKPLEHTGYTSIPKLRQVSAAQGWEAAPSFTPWTFKDDAPASEHPAAQKVTLAFLGTAGYNAEFDYQPETNDYLRFTGNLPHKDASGVQLTAKTIVLMYQKVTNYTDVNGHPAVRVDVTGTGQAVVIEDGVAHPGTWSKSSINERTTLTDAAGNPLALDRGKLWVVSVPLGSPVTY